VKQDTLERYEQSRARLGLAFSRLDEAIANLINSSDLNGRRHEIRDLGSLNSLLATRDQALTEHRSLEQDLIAELNLGLFPGDHRAG
jgi:hypothetical protein